MDVSFTTDGDPSDESFMIESADDCGLVAVKEYERVVGREGSDAVSPPRDDAAWALRNSTISERLRALHRCPSSYSYHVIGIFACENLLVIKFMTQMLFQICYPMLGMPAFLSVILSWTA